MICQFIRPERWFLFGHRGKGVNSLWKGGEENLAQSRTWELRQERIVPGEEDWRTQPGHRVVQSVEY